MKGVLKAVIAGIVIIAVGAAILIGTLAYNGWSFKSPQFETAEYTDYSGNDIDIKIGAGSVVTKFYDGDSVIIEYPDSNVYQTRFEIENGVLHYEGKLRRFHFGNINIPDTVIFLPSNGIFNLNFDVGAGSARLADGTYGNIAIEINAGTYTVDYITCDTLNIDLDMGNVLINGAVCRNFKCDMNMGNVEVKKLDCANTEVEVNMGEMNLAFIGDKSEYGIYAKVSMGDCNVSSQSGTTDKTLNLDVDMGTINVTFNA